MRLDPGAALLVASGAGRPLTVRFRVYRYTDQAASAKEPLVAFEGGPGYPSIGSAGSYLFMLGRLHRTHDLIVMDQRGTGASSVIDCPALQNVVGSYESASAACARRLGARAGAYGSAAVADDLAAILRGLGVARVDVYGDSYGTYAAQAFALHHPGMVRAAVLDGTFDQSFDALEPEESASLRHASRTVCCRSGACSGILRSIGAFDRRLAAHRLVGRGRDQDGYPVRYPLRRRSRRLGPVHVDAHRASHPGHARTRRPRPGVGPDRARHPDGPKRRPGHRDGRAGGPAGASFPANAVDAAGLEPGTVVT